MLNLMNTRLPSFIAACVLTAGWQTHPTRAQAAPANQPPPDNSPHAPKAEPSAATSARPQNAVGPERGERVVFIGNGLAERDVYYSRLETEPLLRYPAQKLVVRNMGRPGDRPTV